MSGGAGGTQDRPLISGGPALMARIREIADGVLASGGALPGINEALRAQLHIEIGQGGSGWLGDLPACRYCGAHGGGGHGGFCPGPYADAAALQRARALAGRWRGYGPDAAYGGELADVLAGRAEP